MHTPTPVDDFGYPIKVRDYVTAEERETPPAGHYGFVERWEISTSTYGGDTYTDCCDV